MTNRLCAVSFFSQFLYVKIPKKKLTNKRKKFELAGDSSYRGSPVLLLPFPQEFHFLSEFITFQRISVRASRSFY